LKGVPALVVGGGRVATGKVRGLLEAEAAVTVVAPTVSDELAHVGAGRTLDQQLGPLNPYERRIVHMAVAEVPGVTTESVGDAFSKTVLISLRK